jgi:predicted nucleotidyltransferase
MTHRAAAIKPKDRDFLRTEEGFFFCVTGYLHPPERYTAYLKYSPTSSGKWRDGETAYKRELPYYHIRTVERTIHYLEQHYPQYVYDCAVRGIRFSMVPQEHVTHYYAAQERMSEILSAPQDPLEEEVRDLALEIAACASISPRDLGITGSTLIGLHDPAFSDIDLTVYGLDKARAVREALRQAKSARIRGLDRDTVAKWANGISNRFPLTVEEAQHLARRRWNYGFFGGRYFSLHPTRVDAEITERYGDRTYHAGGGARVRATLVDAAEALFQPSIYRVADVQVLEGDAGAAEVHEIVSYEGLYRDVADDGSQLEARGKLESVSDGSYRLVVGTSALGGQGYIKPIHH